jgi:hypothetical protein
MRKLFLMLAFLLPLFALEMSADDENAKMKIPLRMESTGKHVRDLIQEPLTCHYYGMLTSIVTTFASDLGDVTLTVTNTSTGEVWYDIFDSVTDPHAIVPLSGTPGFYEITYITSSGDVYEGTLVLN